LPGATASFARSGGRATQFSLNTIEVSAKILHKRGASGAPEEIRTPDSQIRSLEVASLEPSCEQARDLTPVSRRKSQKVPASVLRSLAWPTIKKTEPIPFPVEVTVNGVKVTVTLMLKPGTTVSLVENEQQETKEDRPQGET
jgi:hypothetical protein